MCVRFFVLRRTAAENDLALFLRMFYFIILFLLNVSQVLTTTTTRPRRQQKLRRIGIQNSHSVAKAYLFRNREMSTPNFTCCA